LLATSGAFLSSRRPTDRLNSIHRFNANIANQAKWIVADEMHVTFQRPAIPAIPFTDVHQRTPVVYLPY